MKRNRISQYSKPTTLTALLLVLLLLISGCADPSAMAGEDVTTPAEATTTVPATTTGRPDGLEKQYCNATVEDDFIDNKINIIVFPEYNFVEYTVDDFSEIGCINVYEDTYKPPQEGELGRQLQLTLKERSKENVLKAIKLLEQREDIYKAYPSLIMYPLAVPSDQ